MTRTPSSLRTRNFVLASGSWHGGWCWRPVAERLRAAGHHVFTPTYTGMGERAHLLSKDITIDTFVEDLVQVIKAEELQDVILVGHSFGGVPITGVADRVPQLLSQLIYFDAVVLESGQAVFSNYPKDEAESRIAHAASETEGLAVPVPKSLPAVWGIEKGGPEYEWVMRRLTPHPLGAYTTPLTLQNPVGNGLACTYIHCSQPSHYLLESSRQWVKSKSGWGWVDIPAPHEAHITHPDLFCNVLLELIQ